MRNFFIILLGAVLLSSIEMKGQDVIVKRDGSTVISKVLEVTSDYIKYKKQSNLDGPTYTLKLSEILSINYANGEKEMFSSGDMPLEKSDLNSTASNQEDDYINDGIISSYNDRAVISKLENSKKQAKWVCRLLRIHPLSIVGNRDGRLNVSVYQEKDLSSTEASFILSIENTSDEMMYVDLGNSTFRQLKSAVTYYVNSSTTTSSSSNGGASINAGSIASILGIGGALGSLASGTTIGGGKATGTSTTVYAERIKTIPPHSIYKMGKKDFYDSILDTPYKTDFQIGDKFSYPYPKTLQDSPWEFIVSYAMESDLNAMKRLDMCLYISEEISVESSWDKCIEFPNNLPLIHYFYRVK